MAPSAQIVERSETRVPGREHPVVAVSVVVPVTERCHNLAEIYAAHAQVLKRICQSFEFIFVIDKGFAGVERHLKPLEELGEPIRTLLLPRNYGEATALVVGFEHAQGRAIITLPAYFQAAPEGLESIVTALERGADVVISRRWPRLDSWMNRLQNRMFHAILRTFTGVDLHDLGCGIRGMRREVVREIQLYGDLHRFLPLLAFQRGFRITEVNVPQHPSDCKLRVYRAGIYLRRLLDMLTLVFLFKFTKKPLRFFGLIGTGLFAAGLGISLTLAIQRILGVTGLSDRPLLILGVLLMVLGVQTGSIGLLGEIVIFTHARKMKDYTIEKFLK